MYADDSTLQHYGNNLNVMETEASQKLKKLALWLKKNKLVLNVEKTKLMLFCSRNIINYDFKLVLNDNVVEQVGSHCPEKCIKFLGLNIDDKLNWKNHIKIVCNKVRKIMFTLFMAKQAIPTKLKLTLNNALVKSCLEYGIEYFGLIQQLKV